ncbi:carboxypeptidase regulatory-like domain-containing protein [Lewinella sp. IMCC34191]|uniref:carboxypeptidase regulatory-like domain-containing protein n=1 Tax=Lewinella sp. IMCC34191 TaxID=2259172 RepID=UPI000E23D5B7|nr:carboxypeptidase regulatory-like domain-containing protein [Lewinella sp. IMCC34191]
MNKLTHALLCVAAIVLSWPIGAQFRSDMQAAEKEMELRAYHTAIKSFKRALAQRPDDYDALAQIAEAYRMVNELDTARIYYSQAMKDRKVQPETLLGYAHTLRGLGMYEGAQLLYQAYAREEDPTVGNHFITSATFAQRQREENAGFVAKQLTINTETPEFGASIPQEGKLLFNSGRTHPDFAGVVINRPYVAEVMSDGALGEPTMLTFGYVPTDGSQIGPVHYSPNGRRVVFTRNNFTPGTRQIPEAGPTLSLLIADVNEDGMWSNVRPLPFNGSDYSTGYGTFGRDGQTIYFASDRPGGYGGYDIYRARLEGNDWQPIPENLGPVVNSRGHEITPYADGHSLFFSSNWHHGLGGYDAFRAQLAAGKPITLYHLGSAINSSRDDLGFVFDRNSRTGYVTSNRNGFTGGLEDIYYIMPEEQVTDLTSRAEEGTDLSSTGPAAPTQAGVLPVKPPTLSTMRGYLNDVTTEAPVIDADVMVIKKSTGQEASTWSDSYGAYYASVEPFTDYEVTVEAPGYETMVFDVVTEGSEQTEIFGTTGLSPQSADSPVVASEAPEERGNFGVQIASLLVEPTIAEFENVAMLGNLQVERDGNRRRVRIGYFASRRQAEQVAQEARRKGYSGSFVVEFVPGSTEPTPTAASQPVAVTTPAPAPAERTATKAPEEGLSEYRVQLGAFSRPQNFNREKAWELGILGSESRGQLTVFYIDKISTLQQAEYVREQATALGFVGPYILERTASGYTKR